MSDPHSDDAELRGLKARLENLEDEGTIQELKAMYARNADAVFNNPGHSSAVALADLFTNDGILDLGPFGRYTGRAAIIAACETTLPAVTAWSTHYIVSPIIKVSGPVATGSWYFLIQSVPKSPPHAPVAPIHGSYQDKYKKTAVGWRIAESVTTLFFPPT